MYDRKILILKQVNPRFAQKGREVSAVVKLLDNGKTVDGVLSVKRADIRQFGSWQLAFSSGDKIYRVDVDNLDKFNFAFESPVSAFNCLLVKREDKDYPVAYGSLGESINYYHLIEKPKEKGKVTAEVTSERITETPIETKTNQSEHSHDTDETQYEKFLVTTDNYYADTVGNYKKALDDFYNKKNSDYFESVREQLVALFETYPVYPILSNLMPNSAWVKIQRGNKYFALGIESKDEKPLYICYALAKSQAPISLEDYHIIKQLCTDGRLFK